MPVRRILSSLAFVAALGAVAAVATGCKAGAGDPCKEPNDCSGNLMCCRATPSPTARGVCRASCEDMMEQDGGPRDAGGSDGGEDAGGDDGGADDAGPDAATDAGTDAGPEDAGTDASSDGGPDAGTDAGTDAGPADAGPDA